MDQTIVGDDIRHREHPVVAGFREHVDTGAGQGAPRADERLVHLMDPLDDHARPGQIQHRRRSAGQHGRVGAGGDEFADGSGVQPHVGVEVDAWVGDAYGIAQAQGVRLAGHLRLQHTDTLDPAGRSGRAVGTGVGHHDDVELARRAAVEEAAQIGGDNRFLVVCRDDDADRGLSHGRQNSQTGRTASTAERTEKNRTGVVRR